MAVVVIILVVLGVSARETEFSLTTLFQAGNAEAVTRFVRGLWPPETNVKFLRTIFGLMVETIEISLVGTALAVLVAFPLSLLAVRQRGEEFSRERLGTARWVLRWSLYYLARAFLNLFRGIPELVWALIFVTAVGLGPLPGVLALAVHSTGILGKLYAEMFESVDQRLVEMVRSTGATEMQVLFFARLPLSLPVFLSYTLFRWECNMRAATVLGFVGAGGIGTQLMISMKLFRYNEVMTLILAILILIALVDILGQFLRTRVLDAPGKCLR
ncbi:phosphonate ABC transporter, inner membrane subunit [Calderihabitans maritimus]|uniref:Phosphonate ABC transporter, inner membrane subunit n=1 Tax=Calderihabitans maritimus TaxID=1246530 RepID=A0A1Z5HNX1_9FIRM|nr:phosphonate ABC transporter, inner membrane subunit [Calderihabitans maritimus]